MITLLQAQAWVNKYSNVKIIDQKGEQFRIEIRDTDGNLIWREWDFESNDMMMQYIDQKGILRYESAHVIPHNVAGEQFYIVVLSETESFDPEEYIGGRFKWHMVHEIDEAFDIAAAYNVPLYRDGKQLLEGTFQ